MITTEVQYLVKQGGRPIYYASSAGHDAKYTVDRGLESHRVDLHDAPAGAPPRESFETHAFVFYA
jgi:hypothetical protein